MVQEALFFGWIDSLIKQIDDNRYSIKVTQRQPTSKWSNLNRKLWADLEVAGLLTQASLALAPTNKTYAAKPVIPDLPGYIAMNQILRIQDMYRMGTYGSLMERNDLP